MFLYVTTIEVLKQTSQLCREVKSEIGDVDDTFVDVRGSEMAFRIL